MIVEMGERFHGAAGWGDVVAYDRDSLEQSAASMIASESFRILVLEVDGSIVGMMAAGFMPFYFNYGHLTGTELFLWVEPEHRGCGVELLGAMEREARDAGCSSFTLGAMDGLRPAAVGRLYVRRGYRPNEHTWIRRL